MLEDTPIRDAARTPAISIAAEVTGWPLHHRRAAGCELEPTDWLAARGDTSVMSSAASGRHHGRRSAAAPSPAGP